eukprot:scaffold302667_cov35-Tisochrysis_lutea.AAC.1
MPEIESIISAPQQAVKLPHKGFRKHGVGGQQGMASPMAFLCCFLCHEVCHRTRQKTKRKDLHVDATRLHAFSTLLRFSMSKNAAWMIAAAMSFSRSISSEVGAGAEAGNVLPGPAVLDAFALRYPVTSGCTSGAADVCPPSLDVQQPIAGYCGGRQALPSTGTHLSYSRDMFVDSEL